MGSVGKSLGRVRDLFRNCLETLWELLELVWDLFGFCWGTCMGIVWALLGIVAANTTRKHPGSPRRPAGGTQEPRSAVQQTCPPAVRGPWNWHTRGARSMELAYPRSAVQWTALPPATPSLTTPLNTFSTHLPCIYFIDF